MGFLLQIGWIYETAGGFIHIILSFTGHVRIGRSPTECILYSNTDAVKIIFQRYTVCEFLFCIGMYSGRPSKLIKASRTEALDLCMSWLCLAIKQAFQFEIYNKLR